VGRRARPPCASSLVACVALPARHPRLPTAFATLS
jgi:hypothetical protein